MAIQSANYSTRATRSVQRRRGSLWYLLNKRKRREGWRCIGKQTPYSTRHDFISCLSVIACCCCCCCCCSSSSSSSEKRREVKRGAQDKEMRVPLLLRHCLTVYEWCTRHGTIAAVAEASLYIVLSLSLSGWLLTLNDDERWCTLCIIVYGTTRGILSSLYFLLMFNITRKFVVGEQWVSWDEDQLMDHIFVLLQYSTAAIVESLRWWRMRGTMRLRSRAVSPSIRNFNTNAVSI